MTITIIGITIYLRIDDSFCLFVHIGENSFDYLLIRRFFTSTENQSRTTWSLPFCLLLEKRYLFFESHYLGNMLLLSLYPLHLILLFLILKAFLFLLQLVQKILKIFYLGSLLCKILIF